MPRAADDSTPPPGHWSRWGERTVLMCCPKCRQVATIDHEVDGLGAVSPSVIHEPCGWHVFVTLLEWKP